MKKRLLLTLTALTICIGLTACAGKTDETSETETAGTQEQSVMAEATIEEGSADSPVIDVDENSKLPVDEKMIASAEAEGGDFRDFAVRIKGYVASKNIEALAGLSEYPVYVGSSSNADQGQIVESMDDFMGLGVEKVITEELISAMEAVDPEALTEVEAGYVMMNGTSGPSITFKQEDGSFSITGINY